MDAFTLVGASIIGLTLGMLGSGGSALSVPILIYLVGHGTKQAIAESMAIVACIAVSAAIPYAKAKQIDWHCVLWFGIPGMLGTLFGAWLGGKAPEALQLVVFGSVVLTTACLMLIRVQKKATNTDTGSEETQRPDATSVTMQGAAIGTLTGFVGVGGGFLIVPALVMLSRLPIRIAIGTSLVIVVCNASIGFAKYTQFLSTNNLSVDTQTISIFAAVGIAGSLLGRAVNSQLNQKHLQKVFAYFLILLGTFVMFREGRRLVEPLDRTPVPSTVSASECVTGARGT